MISDKRLLLYFLHWILLLPCPPLPHFFTETLSEKQILEKTVWSLLRMSCSWHQWWIDQQKKASLLACLPACVSREAWDCFFSVFSLVSKGESNLIFCRDFHNLAGFCSRDPVIPFIIQKTLPHPFLSQNSSSEISHCNLCKVNMNVIYHHKLHPAMLYAWTCFQAQSLFFFSF